MHKLGGVKLSSYIYGITTAEIMSILVCVILLCYCVFEHRDKKKTRRDKLYILLLVSCIAALAADALSWLLDGSIRLQPLLYICTTLATLMSFVLICEFIIFLTAYIREKREISPLFEYIYMAFTFAATVFIIVTSVNGKLFTYENGVYADGPWYTAYIIINIIAMLLSLVVFFTYRKSLSRHDFIATLPYIILPCIAAAINAVFPEFSYAYPAVTLALIVVYIMLQINDELQKEINARKALEEAKIAAESANQAKSTFLFNMSHDIRTPMNAIIGFTDIAEKHIDEKDRVLDSLGKVRMSSNHLLSLINDVLDMSRAESGTVKIEEEPVCIDTAKDNIYSILNGNAEAKNILFTSEVDDSVVHHWLYADRLHMMRVLTNIISNSIKYTNPGGQIRLLARELPCEKEGYAHYRYTVSDTGIGMSKEFLAHVFEPFSRADSATKSGVVGTGLGMAITKSLTELMGGTIAIESELGAGTTVILDFENRIAEPVSPLSEIPENESFELAGRKILLVEDNELNREIAAEILEEEGITVDTAEDGDIAVEKMRTAAPNQYDLILMDIQMPRMNGYEATKAIRKLPDPYASSIPIIAMTANAFAEDKENALAAGMNGHLAKPIDVPKLLNTLADILKG